ncbi:unnamed protein product [Rangifer tarandus platyrhynchus]|uniref:Uncharacterized protein n=1 Tax=Rangifer tarandus platyrhynchus TaxID=3082113 RepID=A0ABN9A569_RANTA|nr:unnamed protein product [Rangifer tarandus platyrhynchus]
MRSRLGSQHITTWSPMADLDSVTSGPLKTQLSNRLREHVLTSRDQKAIIRPREASKVQVQRSAFTEDARAGKNLKAMQPPNLSGFWTPQPLTTSPTPQPIGVHHSLTPRAEDSKLADHQGCTVDNTQPVTKAENLEYQLKWKNAPPPPNRRRILATSSVRWRWRRNQAEARGNALVGGGGGDVAGRGGGGGTGRWSGRDRRESVRRGVREESSRLLGRGVGRFCGPQAVGVVLRSHRLPSPPAPDLGRKGWPAALPAVEMVVLMGGAGGGSALENRGPPRGTDGVRPHPSP